MLEWQYLAEVSGHLWPGLLAAAIFTGGLILIYFLPKCKWLAAAILLVLITPVALPGFWFSPGYLGVADWDLYFTYRHQLRRTIFEFGQFPLWNPWMCGGSAALGDPEFPVFSPVFANVLTFGVENGMKITIYVVTAIGAVGMLMLGKRLGFSVYAALVAAIGVAFSSVNLLEVVEGHPNIFSFMWIPWVFWSWLAACRQKNPTFWPMLCGIFLALTFFQGGIYLLSYTAGAFLILLFLVRDHKRAFLVTVSSGLWALGFAAIKLIPTILWLSQFQDESYAGSTYTLPYLHQILFGRLLHGAGEPGDIIPNQGSGWHEYGAYIGPFIGALAIIGLAKFRQNRIVKGLAIAAVLAILLSSSGPVLKPIFDQLSFIPRSNISRIILFAVIPITLLAGYGVDLLRRKASRKWLATFSGIALLALVSGDLFTLAAQLSSQAFVLPNPEIPIPPAPSPITHIAHRYVVRHNDVDYTRVYAAARQGYGTAADCNVLRPKNAIRTIHDQENFGPILVGKQLTVLATAWSPNKITTTVRATSLPTFPEAEVTLNTNYADGWWVRSENDKPAKPAQNLQGKVGTMVPPGEYTLTFWYHPRGMWAGIVVTALTTLTAITLGFATRYRARHSPPRS